MKCDRFEFVFKEFTGSMQLPSSLTDTLKAIDQSFIFNHVQCQMKTCCFWRQIETFRFSFASHNYFYLALQ